MILDAIYDEIMADERLPSPNSVALELLRLTRRDDADGRDLVRLVSADPAICARIMRAANAAASATSATVRSIDQAIARLGFRAIARIAVTFSVLDRNRSGLPGFDYDAFWSESLATGVAARTLAYYRPTLPPDEAFTNGLLSRIGRLALATVHPSRYGDVLATLGRSESHELAEVEREVFGVDSELLSAYMLQHWGMPRLLEALVDEGAGGAGVDIRSRALRDNCRLAAMVARLLFSPMVYREQLAAVMRALEDFGLLPESFSGLFDVVVDTYDEEGRNLELRPHRLQSLEVLCAQTVDPVARSHPTIDTG